MEQNIYSVLIDENPSPILIPAGVYELNISKNPPPVKHRPSFIPKKIKPCVSSFFNAIKLGNETEVYNALEYLNPNITFRGNPALNHAIYYDKINIVVMLIQKGADPALKSKKYNMTAYEEAETKPEILCFLRQN